MTTPITYAEAARKLNRCRTRVYKLVAEGRLDLTLESVEAYKALPKNPIGRPRGSGNPRFLRVDLAEHPEAARYYNRNPESTVEVLTRAGAWRQEVTPFLLAHMTCEECSAADAEIIRGLIDE